MAQYGISSQAPWSLAWELIECETKEGQRYLYNIRNDLSIWKNSPEDHKNEKENKDKNKSKARAVRQQEVPGLDWCICELEDERIFYYNKSSGQRTWTMPAKIKEAVEQWQSDSEEDMEKEVKMSEEEETSMITEIEEIKATPSAADMEANINAFITMLEEYNITPYGTWDIMADKMKNDNRYVQLSNEKDRKNVFETYCKRKLAEKKLLSGDDKQYGTTKTSKEKFFDLLKEANINVRTSLEEVSRRYAKDYRFKSLESKLKEAYFKEYVDELKGLKTKPCSDKLIRDDYFDMLVSLQSITPDTSYNQIKPLIERDPRYMAVKLPTLRQMLFAEYKRQLPSPIDQKDEGIIGNNKERKEIESLKERERMIKKEMDSQSKQIARGKLEFEKETATEIFKVLLAEHIRHPQLSWDEAVVQVSKDSRYQQGRSISNDQKKGLFYDYMDELHESRKSKYYLLLDEIVDNLAVKWDDVKSMIQKDPRSQAFVTNVDDLERHFNSYLVKKRENCIQEFKTLLKEAKFIEYNITSARAEKGQINLQDILAVLNQDKRYHWLEPLPELRQNLIEEEIAAIKRREIQRRMTAGIGRIEGV